MRDDGPKSHLTKAGTPTMGGALILISIGITILLWGDLQERLRVGDPVRHPWFRRRGLGG